MPTVIVVDDDEAIRKALSIRLGTAGFSVITCEHPHAAQPLVLHHRPDLLVLDIEMPRYSGLEFHECLAFSSRGRSIPVLYLTGKDGWDYRLRARKQGAAAFVTKPYDPEELVETVRWLCDRRPAAR